MTSSNVVKYYSIYIYVDGKIWDKHKYTNIDELEQRFGRDIRYLLFDREFIINRAETFIDSETYCYRIFCLTR